MVGRATAKQETWLLGIMMQPPGQYTSQLAICYTVGHILHSWPFATQLALYCTASHLLHTGADLGGGGGGGGTGGRCPPPFCFFTALFSSLLTCCRYVATPGLASSARNTVRCLKPNDFGTRPRSSIPLRVRTYYVRKRNLSKEEAHGVVWRSQTFLCEGLAAPDYSWLPWDLQSSYIWNLQCKAGRCHESPSWEVKNEGVKIFPRIARTDQHYAPLCTASGSVSYIVPPPFHKSCIHPWHSWPYTAQLAICYTVGPILHSWPFATQLCTAAHSLHRPLLHSWPYTAQPAINVHWDSYIWVVIEYREFDKAIASRVHKEIEEQPSIYNLVTHLSLEPGFEARHVLLWIKKQKAPVPERVYN